MIPNRICQDVLLPLTIEVELLGHREGIEGEFSKLQNGINNTQYVNEVWRLLGRMAVKHTGISKNY